MDRKSQIESLRTRIDKFPPDLAKAASIVLATFEGNWSSLPFRHVELVVINIELHLSNLCPVHRIARPSCPVQHC